jgi:hypothetical protein
MMMPISRRAMLKGLGTAISLPWLESMSPVLSWAAPGAPLGAAPKRLAFFYVPNGVHMQDWTPTSEGALTDLPHLLEPLAPVKDQLLVLSGLTVDKARPHGDGPGDHARAMSSFLTGVQIRKTNGADIRAGVSVDQVAAQTHGYATKLSSLELGCEGGRQAGNCDSGYSCAYSSNLSWRGDATPMIKEINPRLVFERLFANSSGQESEAARAKREQYQKSILDFVMEDAKDLRNKLGATDQRKLDEYLSAVREIEERIGRAEKSAEPEQLALAKPAGIPKEYQEHCKLLLDLLALAFQTDQTRIATFVFANDGSNRSYRAAIGVAEGHHDLSHHGGDKEKHEKIKKINRFHLSLFSAFLQKLKTTKEGDGSVLDNAMIVYGSGIGDGNRHNHDDLPILLAGRGGRTLKSGRHIRFPRETPLTNLYLSLLERVDVHLESFGDSRGPLTDI